MLSILKRTGSRDHDDVLVARVEQELSKVAQGGAQPAPLAPTGLEANATTERAAPRIDATFRPTAIEAPAIAFPPSNETDLHEADLHHSDPHDFVPLAPALAAPAAAATDAGHSSFSAMPRTPPDATAGRPVPAVDTTFRPAAADTIPAADPVAGPIADQIAVTRRSFGHRATRACLAFLMAIVGAGATFAWHTHGDEFRQAVSRWAPQVSLASLLPQASPSTAAQPPVQAAAATTAASQPTSPPVSPAAQASPAPVAPATSAQPPEQMQLLQSLTRDVASLQQTIDQLKAGQDQMARELAKLTAQDARRRVVAAPPRPVAAAIPARKPAPLPPPQTRAQPLPEPRQPLAIQPPADPQSSSTPRPPKALP